jgi:superoxide oxidase
MTITDASRPDHASHPTEIRTSRHSFDAVTIGVHWTTVALVISLFVVALLLETTKSAWLARSLLTIHRSLGVTVWTLTAVRLAWRLTGATFPPFPDTMPQVQRHAARGSEYGLYGFLLIQPLSGLAQTLYLGKSFVLFGWSAPVALAPNFVMVRLFHVVHAWGALAFAGLIGLHAGAALFHALVLKDGVFQSMLPHKSDAPDERGQRLDAPPTFEPASYLADRDGLGA